jgi:hypothetical protein
MNKNNGFKETILILVVSYISKSEDYTIDLESLEILDINSNKKLDIKELIEEVLTDPNYIEGLINKAFEYKIKDETPVGHKISGGITLCMYTE